MVRRQEIPQTGVQHHQETARDNILAVDVHDGLGADKTELRIRESSMPTDRLAMELEKHKRQLPSCGSSQK